MFLRDYSWAAGGFYPVDARSANRMIEECMSGTLPALAEKPLLVGGIVPHAGWIFSGPTAGKVFKALSQREKHPRCAICFGSVHVPGVHKPTALRKGAWRTPLGNLEIDSDTANEIFDKLKGEIVENHAPHEEEHSLEVVFPFLKKVFPDVKIVPIMVPPDERSAFVGGEIGELLKERASEILFLGSSDLTHYGSRFGFTPAGIGEKAVKWVKEENDKKLVDMIVAMKAEEIPGYARRSKSACGAGAIAATVSAVRELGAKRGYLLEYTTSYDVQPREGADTFVGYAGIVF